MNLFYVNPMPHYGGIKGIHVLKGIILHSEQLLNKNLNQNNTK